MDGSRLEQGGRAAGSEGHPVRTPAKRMRRLAARDVELGNVPRAQRELQGTGGENDCRASTDSGAESTSAPTIEAIAASESSLVEQVEAASMVALSDELEAVRKRGWKTCFSACVIVWLLSLFVGGLMPVRMNPLPGTVYSMLVSFTISATWYSMTRLVSVGGGGGGAVMVGGGGGGRSYVHAAFYVHRLLFRLTRARGHLFLTHTRTHARTHARTNELPLA